MSSFTFEILTILVLIFANGVFSMSEMAVVSARKVRLQQLANQGNVNAKAALKLAESPNHFLSIVQVGITLINILNGVFGHPAFSSLQAQRRLAVSQGGG